MSTNTFFTADTHFGHTSLITKSLRKIPFDEPTIEKHNEMIVSRWNDVVKKHDTVYHLGDFAWHDIAKYRGRLNGHIHLILGNHDRLKSADYNLFESVQDIKTVKVDGQNLVLCHYAMRVWNKSHYGTYHLYGHSHGSLPEDPNSLSFDVGMDCWAFTPVSFEQVREKMLTKTWKPIDHHK